MLKTYFQAWKNCWDGRADAPNFKGRLRTVMSVDIPQGRDLNIVRVHRRWGMANIPKVGRVRFCWTKDLPVGKHANTGNRITGARLVKDALGWHTASGCPSRSRPSSCAWSSVPPSARHTAHRASAPHAG